MDVLHVIAPLVGGAALEATRWYQLRERLSLVKYQTMLKSSLYWGVTVAMIGFGTLVAIIWAVSKDPVPTPFELLVVGAAAPSLLGNAVTTFLSKESTSLGSDHEHSMSRLEFKDLFVAGNG